MFPTMQKDVYKEFHEHAGHPSISVSYANMTARSGKLANIPGSKGIIFVGMQYFILDYLINDWNKNFFELPCDVACFNHKRILSAMLGYEVSIEYLERLHALGYLPLRIKALSEGSFVPYQVAATTLTNTVEGFDSLPCMIETVMSCENWPIQTSATTSVAYMVNTVKAFDAAGMSHDMLPFMNHDFSFRGMFGRQAAAMSGFGHLCSGSAGTDVIPAVLFAEKFYGANVDKELVGCSVNATEHSVTCGWETEGEVAFIRHLMNGPAEKGILSIVSDTWDFWRLVTEYLPILKDEILARDGKVVIRPDSGDPVEMICGLRHSGKVYDLALYTGGYCENNMDVVNIKGQFYRYDHSDGRVVSDIKVTAHEVKGLVECLWDTFGGTTTTKGYKMLDEHIGAIYGDAITLERQVQITERLMAKGFAPQVVLGIGSYSYQHVTRDTHGSAIKATYVIKDGVGVGISKEPKTDLRKRSARGLLRVEEGENGLVMFDQQTPEQETQGLLETVFLDGKLVKRTTLAEIRARVKVYIDAQAT